MKQFIIALLLAFLAPGKSAAQLSEHAVAANPFWNNWYVQLGFDMSLQNPYGYSFSDVFPNGKTFGVDAALGRWFTP